MAYENSASTMPNLQLLQAKDQFTLKFLNFDTFFAIFWKTCFFYVFKNVKSVFLVFLVNFYVLILVSFLTQFSREIPM